MPALLVALILLATTAIPLAPVARMVVVRGAVSSALGAPIAGANVSVPGALPPQSAQTNASGEYMLHLTIADTATSIDIRARAVGYQPVLNRVARVADTIVVHFVLTQQVSRLGEIVVSSVPGSTASVAAGVTVRATAIGSGIKLRGSSGNAAGSVRDQHNTEEYARIEDNRFLSVASAPLSTFSVDVDRASYANVRRFINTGALPPKDAVRIEELLNYFRYEYQEPAGRHPVTITTDIAAAPWNPQHRVARVGLQTQRIATEQLPPSNLVFLIDVSGSMMPANKLPLVKQAFRLLVEQLREQDRVAIVVYAGSAGLVLPSTPASQKLEILTAIERLEAGGSTAGGAGIRLAYGVAKEHFQAEGNNRVILATDGDFNVGVSSTSELVRFVEERRSDGIALTVLGFGMGNVKDSRLEQLADKGNGNYAYVDDLLEAKKVLVREMGATLLTVAKDVKLQVEFNPARVQAYRLIGYENRLLRNEDFADDAKDAGDMGAGHSVTALYEIIPVGVTANVPVGATSPLRYQDQPAAKRGTSNELMHVNIRYKTPTGSISTLMTHAVRDRQRDPSADLRFAMAVAGYGMLLRDSEFKGNITYDVVLSLAEGSAGEDRDRLDFISLVRATKRVARGVASAPGQD